MIRYALQAELLFSSSAAADAFALDLNDNLSGAVIEHNFISIIDDLNRPVVLGFVRFESSSSLQGLTGRINSRWNSGTPSLRPLSESKYWTHECYNDIDINTPCPTPTVVIK